MTEQPEPGDVGGGVDPDLDHGPRCAVVERGHQVHRRLAQGVRAQTPLDRGRHHAASQRLGQHQHVAGGRPGVGDRLARGEQTGDREAVLGLGVVYGMPTKNGGPTLGHDIGATPDHLCQLGEGKFLAWPAHQLEGGQRCSPHGVDIGQGVDRRDLTPEVGVVDDGGEEVDGLDEMLARRQSENPGVVGSAEANHQGGRHGGGVPGHRADHLGEVEWAQLAAASRAVRELGEPAFDHRPRLTPGQARRTRGSSHA